MGNSRFDDDIRLDRIDDFLNPEHVFRQLDDRPAQPGEAIDIFGVPAGTQPGSRDHRECLGSIQRESARRHLRRAC